MRMTGTSRDPDDKETPEFVQLTERLKEAEETIQAIKGGLVDALVVEGPRGPQVYTLKGAEHPYRRLVEEMSEGAATLLPDGTILYCNLRLAEILQTPLQKVIGSSLYDYVSEDGREAFCRLLGAAGEDEETAGAVGAPDNEVHLQGVTKAEFELMVRPAPDDPKAGGDSRPAAIRVPVYISASSLEVDSTSAICLVVTDLTEQKRNEALVDAGRRKLAEEQLKANKLESIGLLAGGLAHDLNNSLTAILGNIALARRGAIKESVVQRLAEAEAACLQAREVTQQLLTFSKGGVPITRLSSIGSLLTEWASFAASGSNVVCDFQVEEGLWPVEIDEGQISRVINNLVINAQQAMPQGGTITIRAENLALTTPEIAAAGLPLEPGQYVRIAVEDHGTGISKTQMARIFDPYFTTKQKGSGLGLSIAHSIIRNHGGHLAVESELGVGSTFYIYLSAPGTDLAPTSAEDRRAPVRNLRVLVMDDQESIRYMVGQALIEMDDDQVEYARDGEEAIELYRRHIAEGQPFDLVLMDLTIPGAMGGREAIRKLAEIDPDVRAIVFSGYSNDPIMAMYEQYGFKGVLRKPFDLDELLDEVHRAAESE